MRDYQVINDNAMGGLPRCGRLATVPLPEGQTAFARLCVSGLLIGEAQPVPWRVERELSRAG